MTAAFSAYLDLLRVVAAATVFASHALRPPFADVAGPWLQDLGHDAVIVFFVLSGYLVAYAASERDGALSTFTVSRLARLWSVALPALVATLLLDLAGREIDPGAYGRSYEYEHWPRYLLFFATMAHEAWFTAEDVFSNVPFWSLSYEAAFYAIFAGAHFYAGRRALLFAGTAALLAGPKILLLLPAWLVGAALYRFRDRLVPGRKAARAMATLGLGGLVLMKTLHLDVLLNEAVSDALGGLPGQWLRYSRFAVGDLVMAVLIGLNLLGVRHAGWAPPQPRLRALLKAGAGMTFTLYLFHYPLLKFLTVLLGAVLPAALLTLLLVPPLAFLTEWRRDWWRRRLWSLFLRGEALLARLPALHAALVPSGGRAR
ncbi:acyltransferase family protein [Geminicoccaceae bacterium 1502E]|nr:acyltransferase family protein [Geminicoccaceae bacterium 1502E]